MSIVSTGFAVPCAKDMGIRSPRCVRAMCPVLRSRRPVSRCRAPVRLLVGFAPLTYDEENSRSPRTPRAMSMSAETIKANLLELIRRTSAVLPPDVTNVLEMHRALEQQGSRADLALH